MRCAVSWLLGGLLLWNSGARAQSAPSPRALATVLKTSRWQQRVLLLCAPDSGSAALRRQRELLAAASEGLEARDLLVREVLINQLSAADRRYLTQTLLVPTTGFSWLLVGKDGGPKRRGTTPVTPSSLFATIDAMPMRQAEMHSHPRP